MFTTTTGAEGKLVELLGSIEEESKGWKALHFVFSLLLEHYRSNYQIKIAFNLINDLLKEHQGGIFVCDNGEIFVVVRNVTKSQIDKVVFQLRYLFMDDPLAYDAEGEENPEFCRLYDLEMEWGELIAIARKRVIQRGRGKGARPPSKPATPTTARAPSASDEMTRISPPTASSGEPSASASAPQKHADESFARSRPISGKGALSQEVKQFGPQHLARVAQDLANADLSRVMRQQPICAAVPNMMVRKVFDEFYINIAHLRKLLHSDVDFLSNRWLFKYLTVILDERMLDMLMRNATRYLDKPISLNVNVETLLSEKFTEFDAALKPSTKVSIVMELQVADIFNDMQAFMAARSSIQKRGYRICIDGLSTESFIQIDRESLGFDLAKLQWNADIEEDLESKSNRKVVDAVKRCGANRLILCRCDNRRAVDYGQALGISLFQGRFLDKLINPTAQLEN